MNIVDIAIAKNYTNKSMQEAGTIKGEKGDPGKDGADGFTPTIKENISNREDYYRLDIINKDQKFTTPNLMGVIGMEYKNESSGTPVGEIISYMGVTAPPNYLICDGTEYQITDYPHLAQHFADNFGSVNYFGGDGESTFAVPDLRGEFLRGTGTATRDTGTGSAVGIHQNGTSHIALTTRGPNFSVYTPSLTSGGVYATGTDKIISRSTNRRDIKTDSTGVGEDVVFKYTSRPTNTSVLYCIKAKPTYYLNTGHTYSYVERRVGAWVDEKPLYEKMVDFGNLPNATTKEVPHGIEDVDTIWLHDGFVYDPLSKAGDVLPISYPSITSIATSFYFKVNRSSIKCSNAMDSTGLSAIVIVRYTKTTD